MSIGQKMVDRLKRFVEELKAGAELKRLTPPNAELLRLVERHPAPPEWYEEGD